MVLLGCLGFEVSFYNTLVNQKHNEETNIDALPFTYFNANVFAITLWPHQAFYVNTFGTNKTIFW